jgi:hypothetical protein
MVLNLRHQQQRLQILHQSRTVCMCTRRRSFKGRFGFFVFLLSWAKIFFLELASVRTIFVLTMNMLFQIIPEVMILVERM